MFCGVKKFLPPSKNLLKNKAKKSATVTEAANSMKKLNYSSRACSIRGDYNQLGALFITSYRPLARGIILL